MRDVMVNAKVIKKAVRLACRAPSLHNSQPWHWVAEDGAVQLYLDKERVLYSTDHSGREALISCELHWTTSGWQWRPRDGRPM